MTPELRTSSPSTRSVPTGRVDGVAYEPLGARSSRTIVGIRVRPWVAAHPFAVDAMLAVAVAIPPLVFEAVDARDVGARLDLGDVLASALAFALIVLRRRAPLPVFGVALVAAVLAQLPDPDYVVLQVAVCLVLYTVASTATRFVAWTAGAVAATSLFLIAWATTPGPWYGGENLELIAWTVLATALGDAVRSRRSYATAVQERETALHERAERAERALEEEALRQVAEERLRIARELHDVVAHHIAVVNVQAGVATHLVRTDPDGAEEALAHVRRGASSVLDEMGAILSVLRQPDDVTDPTDPLPTLDELDDLIAGFGAAGLDVEWHTSGVPESLTPAVGLAAYRIVQESLTNAHRHGRDDRACLRVDYAAEALRLEVVNDVAAGGRPATGRQGHGLIGMRERVAAAGGTIEVGATDDGRFRVIVTLPTTRSAR